MLKTIWADPEMKNTIGKGNGTKEDKPRTPRQRPFTGLVGEEKEEGASSIKPPASLSGNTDNTQDFPVLEEHINSTQEGGDARRLR